jgi:carbonic anhydrase/acetyltransferase-like protein (isoleucine patch superfamily)
MVHRRMIAYLLQTGSTIPPFGEPVGEMKVHNLALQDYQRQVLERLGLRVQSIGAVDQIKQFPCLVIEDDLYFTYESLARFLRIAAVQREAASGRGNLRAALALSELTEQFAPAFQDEPIDCDGQSLRAYGCYYLREVDYRLPLVQQSKLLGVPYRLRRIRVRANRYFEPSGRFSLPISTVFMVPIRHWSSLLSANVLGMPGFLSWVLRDRWGAALLLPLRMVCRSGSLRPSRWLGKSYLAGRRCRIAASAHVEASLLGDRVRIGPNAVLRGCIVGDEAEIGPGAVLEGCTLGPRATVNGSVLLRCCVADEEASIGSFFGQFSVLGRGAVMCPDSGMFDFQLKGSVRVLHQGQSVPSGSRLLGGCLGHRAFLGPHARVLCGQEIPNDCILVESPRQLIRGVQGGLPEHILRMDEGRREAARLRRAS